MSTKKNKWAIPAVIAALIVICAVIAVVVMRQSAKNSGEYVSLGDYQVTEAHFKYFITKGYDAAYAETGVSDASLLDQTIDGVKADKWIRDYAVKEAQRYLLVNKLFDDLGLELTDEDKQTVNQRFDDQWYTNGRVAVFGPMGIVEETYGDILTAEKKQERLTEYYADELKAELTEEQITDRFKTDHAAAEYIALNYVNGNNESTLDMFNDYKFLLENGEDFEGLLTDTAQGGDSFVVTSVNSDTGKRDVVFDRFGSIFPRNFIKELFAEDIGDIIYYDDSPNMIYVIAKRVDVMADPTNISEYRDETVNTLIGDLYSQRLESEASTNKFSVNKVNADSFDIRGLYGME